MIAPLLATAAVLPFAWSADDGRVLAQMERGGAEGPDVGSLVIPHGDLRLRNIQGDGPNLDIGGGCGHAPECRGNVNVNWDVGRSTFIYDGTKQLVAAFTPNGIRLYRRGHLSVTVSRTGVDFYEHVTFHRGYSSAGR